MFKIIDFNSLSTVNTYSVKTIDTDCFEEMQFLKS